MIVEKETNKIFKISSDKTKVICPPDQVFKKDNFEFLLTIGGNLADNEIEYQNLMTVLRNIGETEFFIVENIGATETNRETPLIGRLSTDSNFSSFQKMGQTFDPNFGWIINHFFVFGNNENCGIYICEYPTINIIGCDKKLANAFRDLCLINGNGFEELDEFISKEFQINPDLKTQLINNYRLEN